MSGFLTLKSVDEILAVVHAFSPLPAETVPLEEGLGRVLAEPLAAPGDLPGFDRAAMDGYAVRAKDVFGASEGLPAILELVGTGAMGEEPAFKVGPGQAAGIWTGGMLPKGADAVVMLEYARPAGEGEIELTRPAAPYDNVIRADEDARAGEELLPAGHALRPQDLGLMAALGQATVRVHRRPRAAIISTGDEIVPIAAVPRPGQVRDINSYSLAALVRSLGAEARPMGIVPDDETELRRKVLEALANTDTVLISGGSSAGQRDFTLKILADIPDNEILAHGVAISPGKPLILARRGNQSMWGLPGHAASALVCSEVFIRPLIRRLSGQTDREIWQTGLRAVLTRPVASAQGRRDFIRVRLEEPAKAGGPLTATPLRGKSGLITTLVMADALVACPEDLEGLYEGQIVDIHLST